MFVLCFYNHIVSTQMYHNSCYNFLFFQNFIEMAKNLEYLYIDVCNHFAPERCQWNSSHECDKCCDCMARRNDIPQQQTVDMNMFRLLDQANGLSDGTDVELSDASDYHDDFRAPFQSPLLKPPSLIRHDARLVFDDALTPNPLAVKRKAPEDIELFKAGGKLALEFPPLRVAPAIQPLNNPLLGLQQSNQPLLGLEEEDDDDLFDSDSSEDELPQQIVEQPQPIAEFLQENAEEQQNNGRGPCVQRWVQTYNNPTITGDELYQRLASNTRIKGFVFQLEVGASGTPHYQMYIEFHNQQFCSAVYNALGTRAVFTAPANGNKKSNIAYCSDPEKRVDGKDGKVYLYGTCADGSKGPGARTDVARFQKALVEKGKIDIQLLDDFPKESLTYIKQAQSLVSVLNYQKARKTELEKWQKQAELKAQGKKYGLKPRELILYFGPSAVGKTTNAFIDAIERFPDHVAYKKQGKTKWWDYYDNERAVVCDEWQRELTGSIESFNDLTNEGIYMGEAKGGQVQIVAEVMYFTTNRHPRDIFNTRWDDGVYRAMVRRFAKVYWWNDACELTELKNPGEKPVFLGEEGEDPRSIEWKTMNDAWVHFWKGKPVQDGTVIINENGQMNSNDQNYFTW